jgi:hypothetical protein
MKINIDCDLYEEEFEHIFEMYLKARRNGLRVIEIYKRNMSFDRGYGIVASSHSGSKTRMNCTDEECRLIFRGVDEN